MRKYKIPSNLKPIQKYRNRKINGLGFTEEIQSELRKIGIELSIAHINRILSGQRFNDIVLDLSFQIAQKRNKKEIKRSIKISSL
jgi:hypothetical protein